MHRRRAGLGRDFRARLVPRAISADEVLSALPHGARVLVQGAAGESQVIADAVQAGIAARPDLSFVGVFLPGVNTHAYGGAFTTFFLTPELKAAGAQFLPLGYNDIRAYFGAAEIDAIMFTASPADAAGQCSFGVAVDFAAELWPQIPIRIAHINPSMPHTRGHAGLPFEALTHVVHADAPLIELNEAPDDEIALAIGRNAAAFVPDGAIVQTGIGKAPGAVMRALRSKKGLNLHTGFISDWALDLHEAGALAANDAVTTGLAIGTPRLYTALHASRFAFQPVAHTHALDVLRSKQGLIAVNGALEVDLFGQAYAERAPNGFASGPGGALDFSRGAKLAGGVRILVLPSMARGASRIVAPGAGRGPVSLSRFDIDVVVTEYGAADLRGCSHDARAERLIAIAAPAHREMLKAAWDAASP